jgi:hypothetical protein
MICNSAFYTYGFLVLLILKTDYFLYSVNHLFSVTKCGIVLFEVRTELLNITYEKLLLQRVKEYCTIL